MLARRAAWPASESVLPTANMRLRGSETLQQHFLWSDGRHHGEEDWYVCCLDVNISAQSQSKYRDVMSWRGGVWLPWYGNTHSPVWRCLFWCWYRYSIPGSLLLNTSPVITLITHNTHITNILLQTFSLDDGRKEKVTSQERPVLCLSIKNSPALRKTACSSEVGKTFERRTFCKMFH